MSRNLDPRSAGPAERHRNCTLPKASIVRLTKSSTCAREVTSTFKASAWLPLPLTAAAVSRAPCSLRSAHTTLACSRAKISAVARPMPLAAPVMMMVLPAKYSGVLGMVSPVCWRRIVPARRPGHNRRSSMPMRSEETLMSSVKPIDYRDAPVNVRAVFDDIKRTRQVADVNNFWKKKKQKQKKKKKKKKKNKKKK